MAPINITSYLSTQVIEVIRFGWKAQWKSTRFATLPE
jgi:hypothetical protein